MRKWTLQEASDLPKALTTELEDSLIKPKSKPDPSTYASYHNNLARLPLTQQKRCY